MRGIRKIIGLFVIVCIAMPTLVGIIWATGFTSAVLTQSFLAEVPQKTVQQLPALLDQFTNMAKGSDAIKNKHARAWIKALDKTKTTPSQILKQIGVYQWLESELSNTLGKFGKMIKGEVAPGQLVLNNKVLKKALAHPAFHQYIKDVLAQLPACQEPQRKVWSQTLQQQKDEDTKLPACNPGTAVTQTMIKKMVAAVVLMPEKISLLKKDIPLLLQMVRIASATMWILFLIPALFLLLGAGIAGGSNSKSFLRWLSIPIVLASLFPFVVSSAVRYATLLALRIDPGHWSEQFQSAYYTPEMQRLMLEKTAPLIESIIAPLMSSVADVALITIIVGGILFLLSFIATGPAETKEA